MTNAQETIPATWKTRFVFQLAALPLMFLFGLFSGTVLSGLNASAIVLGLLIPLALLTAVLDLKRSLPTQNVITIVVMIALFSSVLEMLNAALGFSSDQAAWLDLLGPPLFDIFRWRVPLLWAVNLLNSRSVARMMLRPWRGSQNYGLLSLGVTAVLTAISNSSIVCFGGIEPWAAFFVYATMATIILVAIMPWLINKKTGPISTPGYSPLVLWVMLLGVLFGHRLL
jgi:hypothetical protein